MRTNDLFLKVLERLRDDINAEIEEHNERTDDVLPGIADIDVGYRDVLTGLRCYPSLLVMELSRDCSDAYFTTYSVNFCIAHHGDDIDELQREGSALLDCLEDALRGDHSLGGLVFDVRNMRPEIGVVSGTYVAAMSADVVVDLGSRFGMGGSSD